MMTASEKLGGPRPLYAREAKWNREGLSGAPGLKPVLADNVPKIRVRV